MKQQWMRVHQVYVYEAVDKAVIDCLPLVGLPVQHGGQKVTPEWTEYVKPYQEESKFWHGLWRVAGLPEAGDLCEMNRHAKMQYKYAVRRLKRASYNLQRDKLLTGLLNGGLDIFKKIKKYRWNTNTISSSVGGKLELQILLNKTNA